MNIKFLEHMNLQGRELSTIKGWFYILFLLSSLVFTGLTHDGVTTGDYIFHAIGIPPWSIPELNQGIHYSAIFGIIMIILSGKLTINYFRKQNKKKVGRKVFICCIGFIYMYPFFTEQVYYLLNWRNSGLQVVNLLKEDSRCTYNTHEDTLSIQCNLRMVNYGGQIEQVSIRPIVQGNHDFIGVGSFAEVPLKEIALNPRSNEIYTIHFESKPDERIRNYSAGGTRTDFGIEIVQEDELKEVYI